MLERIWLVFNTIPNVNRASLWLSCLLLISPPSFSQSLPQIEPGGVVNAASYAQPISPGAIVSIFGTNLATTTMTAQGTPLLTELAGTSVTITAFPGRLLKAPLFFVSPNQINLQIPWSAGYMSTDYVQAGFVVTTPAGSSDQPISATFYQSSPSLFSTDSSGCGQGAALNVSPDGTVSVNSPSNSAAPGDYVSLYGTGFGIPQTLPADGTFTTAADPFQTAPEVVLDGNLLSSLSYAGMAPLLVGVGQINFQIPPGTREGCAIPVVVNSAGVIGPTLSISIHSGSGQCVDPPSQSYGLVTLTKTVTSDTGGITDAESLTAAFPSGPGLEFPQAPVPSPSYFETSPIQPIAMSRSCPLNGSAQLSAGTLASQSPASATAGACQAL